MSEKSPTGQVQTWEENTRSERDKRGREEEQIKGRERERKEKDRVRGRQREYTVYLERVTAESTIPRKNLLLLQQNAEEETKCVIWRIWMVCCFFIGYYCASVHLYTCTRFWLCVYVYCVFK